MSEIVGPAARAVKYILLNRKEALIFSHVDL